MWWIIWMGGKIVSIKILDNYFLVFSKIINIKEKIKFMI